MEEGNRVKYFFILLLFVSGGTLLGVFQFDMLSITQHMLIPIKIINLPPKGKFHVIQFMPFRSINNPLYKNLSAEDKSVLLARQSELLTSFEINLNHTAVRMMHIMMTNPQAEDMLKQKCGLYCNIVKFVKFPKAPTYKDMLQYVSDNLIDKDTIVMNSDNYLGEGVENITTKSLKQRVFYALTRSSKQEKECRPKNYCCKDYPYIGSHDTFIFRLNTTMNSDNLKILDYLPTEWGSENRLMWVFAHKMKYRLSNPCLNVKSYHYHCAVGIRSLQGTTRKRVNINGMSASVGCSNLTNTK